MLNYYKKKMQVFTVISLTHAVNDWMENSLHPRILHVFENSCNLINERSEVLSVVSATIGNGPFNVVLKEHIRLSEVLKFNSPVTVSGDRLDIGNLSVITTGAKTWSPRLAWERLHDRREEIGRQLAALPIPYSQSPAATVLNLSSAFASGDISSSKTFASQLAGLGTGLTPAGDDFILGALYAAWTFQPLTVADSLAREVANTTAPLTTSLSAAWLQCGGRGEAGKLWHEFLDALAVSDPYLVQTTMKKIMSIGASSGTEALAGFMATFHSYMEIKKNHVFPRSVL